MKKILRAGICLGCAIPMLTSTVFADKAASSYFHDVNADSYSWAAEAIDYLYEADVVRGTGNDRFSPQLNIKRCDFVLMLNNLFNFPKAEDAFYNFADISETDYYYSALINAKGFRVIQEDGAFYPQTPIKRIDAFNMLYRALDKNGYIGTSATTDVSMYVDSYALLNIEDKIAVGTLTNLGIVHGSDGCINPNSEMTRAEMAVILSSAGKIIDEFIPPVTEEEQEVETIKKQSITETEDFTHAYSLNGESAQFYGTITKSGNGDTNTYFDDGSNAAVYLKNSSLEILDSTIKSMGYKADAIYATGKGELSVSNSTINVGTELSDGIVALKGMAVDISDSKINVAKKDASGILIDASSTLSAKDTVISAENKDCYGISIENKATYEGGSISSTKAGAVKLIGDGTLTLTDTDIISRGGESVFAVYANSKKNFNALAHFTMTGGSIINGDTPLFYVNNNNTVIDLSGVQFASAGVLLDCQYSYESDTTSGSDVTINLSNQTAFGDALLDNYSTLQLNITNGSNYIGAIDPNNNAREASVYLDKSSVWALTDTTYVKVLDLEDETLQNIRDHGNIIYYDPDESKNYWLREQTLPLPMGGVIMPFEDQ